MGVARCRCRVVCAGVVVLSPPHHYACLPAILPHSIIAPYCQHLTFRCVCALNVVHFYACPRTCARDRYTTVTYRRRETLAPEPITRDNGNMNNDKPYRLGGNIASTRVPYGTDKRTARATLARMIAADNPHVKLHGGTTLCESRHGGLLVMVCFSAT